MDDRLSRRKLLGLLTSSSAVAVAGCQDNNTGRETDTKSQIPSSTEVDTPQPDTSSPSETASETPSPTDTPIPTNTPTSTPTPTDIPDKGLNYVRIEDNENLLQEYGEEELTGEELEPNETIHTIQMDGDEREELYSEELFELITEEQYEEIKEHAYHPDIEDFKHWINRLGVGFRDSSVDESNFSKTEHQKLFYAASRNIIQDKWEKNLDQIRFGFIPQIKRTDKETNEIVSEVINQKDDIHKTYRDEPWNNSMKWDNPGIIGTVDGQASMYFGACEFEVMREEINKPWNTALDSINPDKLQGMIRDQLVGFTNWTRVHDELGFEGREEAEKIRSPPTDTPISNGTATPTPSPEEQPFQIAAHEPFVEDYRQSILDGDDLSKKQRMDLSDTLTDYIINRDLNDSYGLVIGGTLDDPDVIEVDYEAADFLDTIHNLEADNSQTVRELAIQYRKQGSVLTMEDETSSSGYTGIAGAAGVGAGIGALLREQYGEEGFTEGIIDTKKALSKQLNKSSNSAFSLSYLIF